MKHYFNFELVGFFNDALHRDIPDGSVEITQTHYAELMEGLSAGLKIVRGKGGLPTLAAQVVTDAETAHRVRCRRDALLAQADARALPDYPQSSVTRDAWLQYRQALRDVTEQSAFPGNVVWPTPPGA